VALRKLTQLDRARDLRDLQSYYDLQIADDEAELRIARTVSRCPLLPAAEPVPA
jgi:hypothetical protein